MAEIPFCLISVALMSHDANSSHLFSDFPMLDQHAASETEIMEIYQCYDSVFGFDSSSSRNNNNLGVASCDVTQRTPSGLFDIIVVLHTGGAAHIIFSWYSTILDSSTV